MQPPEFPDAVAPERRHRVRSLGIELQIHEWGDPAAIPIVLYHGMYDHGRGFDLLAPLLAEQYRVVAIDARGHGDSDWAEGYGWSCDVDDVVNVLRWLGGPAHLLGHSKGGGQVVDAANAAPDLVRCVINLDGFGPPPEDFDHPRRRQTQATTMPEHMGEWLDRRRLAAERREWRPYASLDDLVERRLEQNPRLSREWLRYFLYYGATEHADGWRWKADPHAGNGFSPFQVDWIPFSYRQLTVPLLAVVGSVDDTWGPLAEEVLAPRLAGVAQLERAVVDGAGHFIHMEAPRETARLVLDYVAAL